MTIPLDVAEKWIVSKLGGNAAGVQDRIYNGIAPREAVMPYIIFFLEDGQEVLGVGAVQIMLDSNWVIKVVDNSTTPETIQAIDTTINSLLHKQRDTIGSGEVLGCVRLQPLSYVEVEQGIQYRHRGGVYRIFSQ